MSLTSIRSIDYVILLCGNVPKMRAFYCNVMGFQLAEDEDEWVKFDMGSGFLTLRPRSRWYDGESAAHSAGVQLSFRVAPGEVDTCYRELVAKGVTVVEEPTDQAFGHRTLFFRDPEANILEIYAEL